MDGTGVLTGADNSSGSAAGYAFFVEGKIAAPSGRLKADAIVADTNSRRRTGRAKAVGAAEIVPRRGAAGIGFSGAPVPGIMPSFLSGEITGKIFAGKGNASRHQKRPREVFSLTPSGVGAYRVF